jgi:hypothetical protein
MGIVEFFVLLLVVVIFAALTVWAIGKFAPGTPALVTNIVWGVAIVIIVVTLLRATGIIGMDPQIPRIR